MEKIHDSISVKKLTARKLPPINNKEGLFPLHSIMSFTATRGRGKTNAIVNLLLGYIKEDIVRPSEIFIICPTLESNTIYELLKVPKQNLYTDATMGIGAIEDAVQKMEFPAYEYLRFLQYKKVYLKFVRQVNSGKVLTLDENELALLNNANFEPPPEEIHRPCPFIIIDDMTYTDLYSSSAKNPLINLTLRHRHINHGIGVSLIFSGQNFKSLPRSLRQNVQIHFMWGSADMSHLENIYEEIGGEISKNTFYRLFNYVTEKSKHDFLTIDTNPSKESLRYRHGFDIAIDINIFKRSLEAVGLTKSKRSRIE